MLISTTFRAESHFLLGPINARVYNKEHSFIGAVVQFNVGVPKKLKWAAQIIENMNTEEDYFVYLVIDSRNPAGGHWAAFTGGVRTICVNNENCKNINCTFTHTPRDRILTVGSAVKLCKHCTSGKCNRWQSAPGFYHLPTGWIVDKCAHVDDLPGYGIPIPQFIRSVKVKHANLELQKDLPEKGPQEIKWATIEKPIKYLRDEPPKNVGVLNGQRTLVLENIERLKVRARDSITADDLLIVLQDQIKSAQELIKRLE